MDEKLYDKSCMFYSSDYHFEMISLLNIRKELKENKAIIVLTQNDLTETVEMILSRTNFETKEKEEFKKIDWTKNEEKKYKIIKKNIQNSKQVSIYIKGNRDYIKKQNEKIFKLTKENKNIYITDCYNIDEIKDMTNAIIKEYKYSLLTGKRVANY